MCVGLKRSILSLKTNKMEFSLEQVAQVLGGNVEGDPSAKVNTLSKIQEGKPGSLAFLANPKYESFIYETNATAVIVNEDFKPKNKTSFCNTYCRNKWKRKYRKVFISLSIQKEL